MGIYVIMVIYFIIVWSVLCEYYFICYLVFNLKLRMKIRFNFFSFK